MSPETLEKLFGAFVQADASTTRRYGGTGLGLNIAMRLAQLMDGGIEVVSQEGQGSTFTLCFVAEAAYTPAIDAVDGADHSQDVHAGGPPRQLSVLVVDDHPVNRKVASLMLTQFGCHVVEAGDGQAALDALADLRVDIVLMDVNMPVMDGRDATRRIRASPHWAHIPIVALTADAGADDIGLCLAAGMNAHLPKPINAGALWTKIVDLVGQAPPAGEAPQQAEAL